MKLGMAFFTNSVLLGVGLAMDAFSVSLANGLSNTKMRIHRVVLIAGVFAFFQALMPMTGWFFVHTMAEHFKTFSVLIPWIALALLTYIGSKMLWEGMHSEKDCECEEASNLVRCLPLRTLLLQGVATSIDALSVGFTIAHYGLFEALLCCLMISVVTFGLCFCGVEIGKRFGTKLAGKASVLGGVILIAIGLEIWISGVFF